jgi:hypothetical protein
MIADENAVKRNIFLAILSESNRASQADPDRQGGHAQDPVLHIHLSFNDITLHGQAAFRPPDLGTQFLLMAETRVLTL